MIERQLLEAIRVDTLLLHRIAGDTAPIRERLNPSKVIVHGARPDGFMVRGPGLRIWFPDFGSAIRTANHHALRLGAVRLVDAMGARRATMCRPDRKG